jgi:hypothetical protein
MANGPVGRAACPDHRPRSLLQRGLLLAGEQVEQPAAPCTTLTMRLSSSGSLQTESVRGLTSTSRTRRGGENGQPQLLQPVRGRCHEGVPGGEKRCGGGGIVPACKGGQSGQEFYQPSKDGIGICTTAMEYFSIE